jgi:hypothetical protein
MAERLFPRELSVVLIDSEDASPLAALLPGVGMNLSHVSVLVATTAILFVAPILAAENPNIVVILADDLGYGDVKCLNPHGKIPTPNIDKLAASGMTFTDGNSPSSVCSPTRTGSRRSCRDWRQGLEGGEDQHVTPERGPTCRVTSPKRSSVIPAA